MAECTIRLVSNPRTGKRDIYIDYESERDALPHEHEEDHRDLVKRVLGDDIFDQGDIGQVVVSRGESGEVEGQSSREDLERGDALPEGERG